jgi:hypothetical protein
MKNKNKYLIAFLVVIASFLMASSAQAVCPICTVAVGAGVGLSRWIGIDDTITGLWIGGLTVSMIMWTIDWLDRKNIHFKERKAIVAIVYYLLIVAPLYWMDIIGHPFNKIWGIDKLFLGIVFGSIVFWSGANWYFYLKVKNNGHAYFPFQKVVMPVSPLIILSFIFYFLTK